jgi:hypothetical protein
MTGKEWAQLGARIAGDMLGALFDAFEEGKDIEPLISHLPTDTQEAVRRAAEDEAMRAKLERMRTGEG